MKGNSSLDLLLKEDPRYKREAYQFVSEALEFTVGRLPERRHVSGSELSEGIRDYALEQFGPLAREVFLSLGIRSTNDFGEIVFNLIKIGIMSKTQDDRPEDFHNLYDFNSVFDEGFRIEITEDMEF